MPFQIESALVIALRNTIKWEAAVQEELPVVDPDARFNQVDYQRRDRALAFRDLLVSAAIIEASIQVSDVYNYATLKPNMQGPVPNAYSFDITEAGNLNSQVRHVGQTSIAWDAARYADADLYGRDALVYETLARACKEAFVDSPVPRIDPEGNDIIDTATWSLAEGINSREDINSARAMDRDLFKLPDQNLADRDNQLAAYTSRLVKILQNPFKHALRIYVQTTVKGAIERESDIYAMVSDDGINRVFQAEPALANANQIIYNIADQTLQWIREKVDDVHVPQIYGLAVPGIDPNQVLQTMPQVPSRQDAQFWRGKSGQIVPTGPSRTDEAWIDHTDTSTTSGGYDQTTCASLTVPGNLFVTWPSLSLGTKEFNLLVKPNPVVSIAGQSNSSSITGIDGGVSYPINIPSGGITAHVYLVEGGDGIVYNGVTYAPGTTFAGTDTVATYTQITPALPSTVRQSTMNWTLALPPGSWRMQFEYTDTTGLTNGFGVAVRSTPSDSDVVDIRSDVIPLAIGKANELLLSQANAFDVANNLPFTLKFTWTYGTGQLHIRRIILTCLNRTTAQYAVTGKFQTSNSRVEFVGQAYQPEVIKLDAIADTKTASTLRVTTETYSELPLQILQIDVQATASYPATPLSGNFQGWRQDCLDRAERAVQHGYNYTLASFTAAGSVIPTFRDSGSFWSKEATELWMAFVEVGNPRLRELAHVTRITAGRQYKVISQVQYAGETYVVGEKFYGVAGVDTYTGSASQVGAFVKSRPGHVGQPCLIPTGLHYVQNGTGDIKAYWDTPNSLPTLVTCQPWMIEYGLYTAQSEFWMPDTL